MKKPLLKNLWHVFVFAALFVVFAVCLVIALQTNTAKYGVKIFEGLNESVYKPVGMFLKIATNSGNTMSVIMVIAILLAVPNRFFRNNIALPAGLATLASWLTNEGVKHLVRRSRPAVESLVTANGYSFPSGHAMNNAALYFTLFFLTYRYMKKGILKNIILVLLVLIPLIIAFSRVYVGVHYTTDVLAGLSLGMAVAYATNLITAHNFKGIENASKNK